QQQPKSRPQHGKIPIVIRRHRTPKLLPHPTLPTRHPKTGNISCLPNHNSPSRTSLTIPPPLLTRPHSGQKVPRDHLHTRRAHPRHPINNTRHHDRHLPNHARHHRRHHRNHSRHHRRHLLNHSRHHRRHHLNHARHHRR